METADQRQLTMRSDKKLAEIILCGTISHADEAGLVAVYGHHDENKLGAGGSRHIGNGLRSAR
jgi:hypothetical protein